MTHDRRFNPRPRAGSDAQQHRRQLSHGARHCMFQSTPPRGKRPGARALRPIEVTAFQSTPPRGKRLWYYQGSASSDRGYSGFNPRPRAGSDPSDRVTPRYWWPRIVSIHAPAREATRSCRRPAVAHEAGFNPRPRAGSDSRRWRGGSRMDRRVSIHAPAREATLRAGRAASTTWDKFQSTPPRGKRLQRRASQRLPDRGFAMFQSTPPRGKRRAGADTVAARLVHLEGCRFNPRPRAGSDLRTQSRSLSVMNARVSIHAPAREATLVPLHGPLRTYRRRFNPRPRAGSDCQRLGAIDRRVR